MAITSNRISQKNIVTQPYSRVDIGGSDLETVSGDGGWVRLTANQKFMAYVTIGAYDAADTLDTLQIEEAKNSSGLGAQVLTTKSITLLAADVVDGAVFVLECDGSELEDLYGYVRINAAESLDTGVDEVSVVYIRDKGDGELTESNARV